MSGYQSPPPDFRIKAVYIPPSSKFKPAPGVQLLPGDGPFERCLLETDGQFLSPSHLAKGLVVQLLVQPGRSSLHLQRVEMKKTAALRKDEDRQLPQRLPPAGDVLHVEVYAVLSPQIRLVYGADDPDEPTIALAGLEHLRNLAEVKRLLPIIGPLLDWHRAGRPPMQPSEAEARRDLMAKARKLKRDSPNLTWDQIAARLGVSGRSLRRWRQRFPDTEPR